MNKTNNYIFNNSKNNSSNLKKKVLPIVLQVEFNTIMNLLKDLKIIRTFFVREMHGIASSTLFSSKLSKNKDFYIIFPKIKGDLLQINDFLMNNDFNKNFDNNYLYKFQMIFYDQWENHRKIILRFKHIIKDKKENSNNLININSEDKLSNYIDMIISYYVNINDNSTIIINELLYDLNENIFSRFYDIVEIYYQKLKTFLEKNFKIYTCNESILINRSILQIFNYIICLKAFHNKRFEIREIQKYKEEINIYIDIRDKEFPNSIYQAKCIILKLSDISSFVSILLLIDVNYFTLSKRFSTLKAAVILVLKCLKKNIEKEIIDS